VDSPRWIASHGAGLVLPGTRRRRNASWPGFSTGLRNCWRTSPGFCRKCADRSRSWWLAMTSACKRDRRCPAPPIANCSSRGTSGSTTTQVRDDVRRRLEIFMPGGGYVWNQVHNVMADVPPENVVAMLEAAHEFGCY